MDIGARLKEERVSKGISLDELQEVTKIQKRYLAAIEEGKLEILPGKFYARAFIKEYANAVGLDSSELLEEHKEEIPKTEEESTVQYSRIERSRTESNAEKSSRFFSVFPKIIVVLLIIGIIFVLLYFIREGVSTNGTNTDTDHNNNEEVIINNPNDVADEGTEENDEDTEEPTENEEDPVDDKDENKEEETVEFVVIEEGTGASPESTIELNNVGEEIIVLLESADGNTWLDVRDADNKAFYSANFDESNSPHEIDMSHTDRIFFNVGNVQALTIQVNGVELEYPVDTSKVHQRLWININKETE